MEMGKVEWMDQKGKRTLLERHRIELENENNTTRNVQEGFLVQQKNQKLFSGDLRLALGSITVYGMIGSGVNGGMGCFSNILINIQEVLKYEVPERRGWRKGTNINKMQFLFEGELAVLWGRMSYTHTQGG